MHNPKIQLTNPKIRLHCFRRGYLNSLQSIGSLFHLKFINFSQFELWAPKTYISSSGQVLHAGNPTFSGSFGQNWTTSGLFGSSNTINAPAVYLFRMVSKCYPKSSHFYLSSVGTFLACCMWCPCCKVQKHWRQSCRNLNVYVIIPAVFTTHENGKYITYSFTARWSPPINGGNVNRLSDMFFAVYKYLWCAPRSLNVDDLAQSLFGQLLRLCRGFIRAFDLLLLRDSWIAPATSFLFPEFHQQYYHVFNASQFLASYICDSSFD